MTGGSGASGARPCLVCAVPAQGSSGGSSAADYQHFFSAEKLCEGQSPTSGGCDLLCADAQPWLSLCLSPGLADFQRLSGTPLVPAPHSGQ